MSAAPGHPTRRKRGPGVAQGRTVIALPHGGEVRDVQGTAVQSRPRAEADRRAVQCR
jgi:hypothetical protein